MAGTTEKGRKISEAKTGVRQVNVADDEILLTEAVKEGFATYAELREGISSGPHGLVGKRWLRHRTEPVPGGRRATIFLRRDLVEDLAAWREKAGSKKARGSRERRARERDEMTARGAVQLRDAVAAVDPVLDLDTVREWVSRTDPGSVIRGPRGDYWVRSQEEFEADLEPFRCSKEGCSRFALLSTSVRPRCRVHAPYVDRGDRLTAEEFADKHNVDYPSLLVRLEASEIPAEKVDRSGRPGAWLIDEAEAVPVLRERFNCETPGCERFALGLKSRHCFMHAGGAASAARAPLIREQIAAEGLLTQEQALVAHPYAYSAERMQLAAKSGDLWGELRRYGGEWRWVYWPGGEKGLAAWKPPWADNPRRLKVARRLHGLRSFRRIQGRMARMRAAQRDKSVGRPPGRFNLAAEEVEKIRELHAAGHHQRTIARLVGVSRGQVQRVLRAVAN